MDPTLHPVLDVLIAACLVMAGIFGFVGSFGLLKLRDQISRLHAPTKASTLGVGGVLIASVLFSFATGSGSSHELLITIFLFLTSPITSLFLAKAYIHRNRDLYTLPDPGEDACWAVFDDRTPDRMKAE